MSQQSDTRSKSCESCTMPIESGPYCSHCADEKGDLRPFSGRFDAMVAWSMHENSELSRAQAEQRTLDFMGKLPAWADHPDYLSRLASS